MKTSLPKTPLEAINESLRVSNSAFMEMYAGETGGRQPVHTVYGGAHLFKSDSAPRLGRVAERAMAEYAPDFIIFAQTLGLPDVDQLPDVLSYAQDLKAQLASNPDAAREEHRAAWLAHTGGRLPNNFVVTLPKITTPEQVSALADLFDLLEKQTGLAPGSLQMEMMIETTQSIIRSDGRINLPLLLHAARGRRSEEHTS